MSNVLLNGSGCKDITAGTAILNVQKDEKKRLIADLRAMAKRRGYRIKGVIELKEIKEG